MDQRFNYRAANETVLPQIVELLQHAGLPVADIENPSIKFLAAYSPTGEIIGCIGLEQYGKNGLLRSLAVQNGYRNKNIGSALVNELIGLGRVQQISKLHLLTTTAEIFFQRRGFKATNRSSAPGSIKQTAEFSGICPASAIYMVYGLT